LCKCCQRRRQDFERDSMHRAERYVTVILFGRPGLTISKINAMLKRRPQRHRVLTRREMQTRIHHGSPQLCTRYLMN
jgi:hypothetical protein